jgi:hypothetical protein
MVGLVDGRPGPERATVLRTVGIPCVITGGQLQMQRLTWPDYCACCGRPSPGVAATVSHTARYASSTTDTGISRTTTTSGYPVAWEAPTCPKCLEHQRQSTNDTPKGLLMGLWVLAAFVVGFGLYSMGRYGQGIASSNGVG